MGSQCHQEHPPCLKDKEELDRDNPVDDEECVGHAGKHLWTRQCDEQGAALKFFGHTLLKSAGFGLWIYPTCQIPMNLQTRIVLQKLCQFVAQ